MYNKLAVVWRWCSDVVWYRGSCGNWGGVERCWTGGRTSDLANCCKYAMEQFLVTKQLIRQNRKYRKTEPT